MITTVSAGPNERVYGLTARPDVDSDPRIAPGMLVYLFGAQGGGKTTLLNRIRSLACQPENQRPADWTPPVVDLEPLRSMMARSPVKLQTVLNAIGTSFYGVHRGTLLLDEPETIGLHPYVREELGRVFSELAANGIQVVVATNCPYLVGGSTGSTMVRVQWWPDEPEAEVAP